MIEVSHLTKVYGDHKAVDDISFTIEPGKIYGFLGPNGAGKSTTMNIMTGYIAATSGTVTVDEDSIVEEPELVKKKIGYLPEIPPLYPEMTVEEYLKFAAGLKKIPKEERKNQVDMVCAMTGLDEYRKRLIANLSKGYKQRVGLAQAVLGMPEIIILDEPTVGLDPRQIIEIRNLIKKLGEEHTVILSSHILQEVSAVCDHIIMIARGHVVANDTPENLITTYVKERRIEAIVKGDYNRLLKLLKELVGVKDSDVVPFPKEPDTYLVVVSSEKDVDLREKLFHLLVENNAVILSFKNDEPTLEDVFLDLVNQEEERYLAEEERRSKMAREKDKKPEAEAEEQAAVTAVEETDAGEDET